MSEWWTYSLEDFLLFSPRTYYRLFELYNEEIWPAHLLTLAIAAAIVILLLLRESWSARAIAALLAALWLFVAWAYLLERYAAINWAATYAAGAFALEALLIVWTGVFRRRLVFESNASALNIAALALFGFAVLIEPALGLVFGRPLAQAEVFGIAPDPTGVATLAILLTATRVHTHLLIVPLLWCVFSALTLVAMNVPDAIVMIAAGCIGMGLAVGKWLSRRERN
jgi:hypothetical protein